MDKPTVRPEDGASNVDTTSHRHIGDQYEVPAYQPHSSFAALKDRIRQHYDLASDYYYSLWGQHIHHGYFQSPDDTKERAQIRLMELLLDISQLSPDSRVLDVGCGIGGTARFLAKHLHCTVTGITISSRQVDLARKLTRDEAGKSTQEHDGDDFIALGQGKVRFIELDAEKMGEYFGHGSDDAAQFDCVWISEAMSHLPDKALFFGNATRVLKPGGKLVVADWFKGEGLTQSQLDADIKPIEDGMLLPPLCTPTDYVHLANQAQLDVFSKPLDISKDVAKTWDISWTLIQSPALWAFALSQGRDGLAFLQAFRAMRRGYANGTFRYAVMAFRK